ncbi:MAG TPA: epoxide hydrolase, partial [Acidimicrobiaceae bacterium]|nr:epoxide hydrolase [Acidimicrobiaceae bacterium]
MSSMRLSTIAVNGVELVVHEAGDPANPTVVLSHGFPELAHSWRHQMAPLAEAGYHVIAPDQRGYGHSSAPREVSAYGTDNLTADLFALLDHYGKADAIFVGHDWGGFVVWQMPLRHPGRVAGVVGVNTPHWDRAPMDPIELFRQR